MRVEKRDGSVERRILIGMIVDDNVCGRVSLKWERDLFKSSWSNLVATWCVRFYRKYEKAPRKAIEGLFESWASDNKNKETTELVEKFLGSLSGEYDGLAHESNSDYLIDLAGQHFNKVRLSRLAESIQGHLDTGEADKAEELLSKFGKLELGNGEGINVLEDPTALRQAFEARSEPLIQYPGALGHFINRALVRDSFVAITAPEKRGKTFWLMDLAWQAMLQRRRVAFFAVGDMSQDQMILRFAARAAKHPVEATRKDEPVRWPKALHRGEGIEVDVEYEEYFFEKGLSWRQAWKAYKKVIEEKTKSSEPLLKLSCHPNSTINMSGVHSIVQGWERSGWVPDVIIIDYADILAPLAGVADTRDQINATWKAMRGLSQSMHCLLITATQSDAASYSVEIITRANFSDDKRKNAHVTALIALNQNDTEKDQGIWRLNYTQLREGAFSEKKCVFVAGCLPLANPTVRSTF